MATEILKSFSHLQNELEEAKSSLKGVDENIKRLIGRDPSEIPTRIGQKRPVDEKNARPPQSKFTRGFDNEQTRRRNPNSVSVFKRLSEKVVDDPVDLPSRGLISKVIPAPKEIPSRQDVLDKQNKDERFKERNRRMFGALLGTLQKFQQEESKLKKKEEKRTQIEKKIEEHEKQEKEEIKKERQELFLNRKRKQQEIKMIELKMLRMKEYATWEQMQRPRGNFIITKAKPHIHYLPRRLNEKSKELLEESKKSIEEQIEKRKQVISEELNHIEERVKRNFESKTNPEPQQQEEKSTNRHDRHGSESEMDDDIEMKERSPSPGTKEVSKKEDDSQIETKPEELNGDDNQVANNDTSVVIQSAQTTVIAVQEVEMGVSLNDNSVTYGEIVTISMKEDAPVEGEEQTF
ncbi:hypothetical protein ABEB36_002214 [Hypothenemus hampei]|uniref:Pinin n=1 Tax=Hypothenemus hampei TaxID=57062 RepID=A0ABD1F4Y1_HYPHA